MREKRFELSNAVLPVTKSETCDILCFKLDSAFSPSSVFGGETLHRAATQTGANDKGAKMKKWTRMTLKLTF